MKIGLKYLILLILVVNFVTVLIIKKNINNILPNW